MDIVEEMRGFEIDHGPDGWPAVRMRQISALCDEIERLRRLVGGDDDLSQHETTKKNVLDERTKKAMHILRNPFGWDTEERRRAAHDACNAIERLHAAYESAAFGAHRPAGFERTGHENY